MRHCLIILAAWVALSVPAAAAPKQHTLVFGKWTPVKLFVGPNEDKFVDIKIRSLYADGKLREFTTGDAHDVTDRLFVVRRAYRVNDWLPADEGKPHKWQWQRGGWVLMDRETGRITQLNLPYFDPFYSLASWYRDYAAYCGVSEDGTKLYAVVAQLGRKKPLLKRELGTVKDADMPDAQCAAPEWQRQPSRVIFAPTGGQKLSFNVRAHSTDVVTADPAASEEEK